MLSIEFINDSTGTPITGNYDYRVKINGQIIATGRVEGHYRPGGWEGLVKKLARQVKVKKGMQEFGTKFSEEVLRLCLHELR